MNRRNFLKNSIAIAPLSMGNFTENTIEPKVPIKVMATNWGFDGSMDSFCKKAKELGYDGIEIWWPSDVDKRKVALDALQKHELEVGFLAGGNGPDFDKHFKDFKAAVSQSSQFSSQKALYINCHSGKDYFTFEQNSKLIEYTIEQSEKSNMKILHETHRGRMCFAAHITEKFLQKYPKMKLTLDISHWCNVHESLLADQNAAVDLALQNVQHIHARIGHEEGPQVNDPRAPEWSKTVEQHFEWWDKAVAAQIKANAKHITFLTEFGPPNYLPTLPYTKQPIANQMEINVHMLKTLKARYS